MNLKISLLTILLIQINKLISSQNFNDTCVNQCQKCEDRTIECRGLNLLSLNFLKNSLTSSESITFTGNKIGIINDVIFSNEMPFLELLDLSENKIIRAENLTAFQNLPNLFELILDNNQLDLDTMDHFSSLKLISNSLERLSLNRAFTESKVIDYTRSAQIDWEIHSLLKYSGLNNIFELRLKENSLVTFNIKPTFNLTDETDDPNEFDDYSDILCVLPKLKILYLDKNFIESFDFDLNCLNENKTSSLELIHLESNRINTINYEQIQNFKTLSEFNSYFRVYLSNNPFKCDCELLEFYKWLLSNESTDIVYNKLNLICSHEDSFRATLNQAIVNSDLESYCQGVTTKALPTHTHFLKPKIYFPRRNRTRTTRPQTYSSLNFKKLILFLLIICIVSLIVVLVFKYQCIPMLRKRRMNRYSHLEEDIYSSVDGTGLRSLQNSRINFKRDDDNISRESDDGKIKKTNVYKEKNGNIRTYVKNKIPSWHKSPNGEISTLPYDQFDQDFGQAKSVPNGRLNATTSKIISKIRSLKTKQASTTDESDKEELTIMDAAVNNIQIKSNSNEQQTKKVPADLFVRIP